jgi:hypothetical protein
MAFPNVPEVLAISLPFLSLICISIGFLHGEFPHPMTTALEQLFMGCINMCINTSVLLFLEIIVFILFHFSQCSQCAWYSTLEVKEFIMPTHVVSMMSETLAGNLCVQFVLFKFCIIEYN